MLHPKITSVAYLAPADGAVNDYYCPPNYFMLSATAIASPSGMWSCGYTPIQTGDEYGLALNGCTGQAPGDTGYYVQLICATFSGAS